MASKIQIAIREYSDSMNGTRVACVDMAPSEFDCIVGTSSGATAAREALRANMLEAMRRHIASEHNAGMRVIGTNDGHVLVLSWEHSGSQYVLRIAGPDRQSMSSSMSSRWKRLDDALRDVREHADQSFGGIAWQNY